MNSDKWLQITGVVHVGEEVSMETLSIQAFVVDYASEILDIGWVFTFARDPYNAQAKFLRDAVFDMCFQLVGHIIWQFRNAFVVIRLPFVDFVEFEEETWLALFVSITFRRGAWIESFQVNFA